MPVMALFAALGAATPFTNVSFGLFHNLDQLLANRSQMTLSIWIFGGTITLSSKIFLASLYINNNKKLVIDPNWGK